jgi:hypothetical protein
MRTDNDEHGCEGPVRVMTAIAVGKVAIPQPPDDR